MKSNKLDHFEIENIEDCLGFFEKDFNIKLKIMKLKRFPILMNFVI